MSFLSKASGATKSNTATGADGEALPLQAKLRMGRAGDAFEQEADRVADRVVTSQAGESVQAQEEDEESLQAKAVAGDITSLAQRQPEEEEEPVQTQIEEEEPIQAQLEEEEQEPVQAQAEEEEESVQAQAEEGPVPDQALVEEEEDDPLQAKAIAAREVNDPDLEAALQASKSGGAPLDSEVLQAMEARFGTQFEHVRIHTGDTAARLARQLNAKAFTHGRHIYFNEGNYDPSSAEGKRLLAHELTHVIQQTGRVDRQMIQRQGEGQTGSQNKNNGILDEATGTLTFDRLPVPPFKTALQEYQGELRLPKGRYQRGVELGKPQSDWKTAFGPPSDGVVRPVLLDKLRSHAFGNQNAGDAGRDFRAGGVYAFNAPGTTANNRRVIGTLSQAVTEFGSPTWNKQGRRGIFHVDHMLELQLNGADALTNMHLLRGDINVRSGFSINNRIKQAVRRHVRSKREPSESGRPVPNTELNAILNGYDIVFEQAIADRGFSQTNFNPQRDIWQANEIRAGQHFQVPNIARLIEVQDLSALGDARRFLLFPGEAGWIGKTFRNITEVTNKQEREWLAPWEVAEKRVEQVGSEGGGQEDVLSALMIKLNERSVTAGSRARIRYEEQPERPINVTRYEGAKYAGYINKTAFLNEARRLRLKTLSPIQIDTFDLDTNRGVVARGQVLPTVPLIRDIGLQFTLENGDATIFKQFSGGEINVPAPFSIGGSTLTLFGSTERGLGIEGRVEFGIENVGDGFIGAAASTSGGFELEGEFNFDSNLFTPAQVGVTYRNEIWGVSGKIGISEGKVRGVKSAEIDVAYAEGNFTASGAAELDVPGVERGTMQVEYSEAGFSIGGTFNLSGDIPGIRGGSVSATVRKVAGEEGYRLTASGTAVPDIPGIDSQLSVAYDNGAITISGRATYERGLLSGQIEVGATNRAVDDSGQPAGDPTDNFTVFGGGSLTITLTPWLQGTVGVRFLPNGEIEVAGRIGLPSSLEVFRRIGIPERELFGIGFDIPIFAIPVGPKSIGLKATIRGALKAYAGIGPGTLEQLELGVVYNPARVDETRVTGAGRFVIPADAGLKLAVRATVGLDALIGGVEGGLEVAAGLGLEAAAEAGVSVEWTPATGLELNAHLAAHVQPKFIFNIDGVITAWFAWYEKEWRWRLSEFEYGSNLRFGVRLPVRYRSGEPFDVNFNDLEIERPDIDASSLLQGLIRNIRNRRD